MTPSQASFYYNDGAVLHVLYAYERTLDSFKYCYEVQDEEIRNDIDTGASPFGEMVLAYELVAP